MLISYGQNSVMNKPILRFCRIVATFLVVMAGAPVVAHAQQRVVLAAEDDYPPYSYVDADGNAAGLYADILHAAAAQMDEFEIELVPLPWNRALEAVRRGEILGFYPPYIWTEERPGVDRYSTPLLTETVVVICHHDRVTPESFGPYPPRWPEDFHGLTVGNTDGYLSPGRAFFRAVDRGDIFLAIASTTEANLRKLLVGHVDCYVNARPAIAYGWEILGVEDPAAVGIFEAAVVDRYTGHVGYTANDAAFPHKDAFADRLDEVIEGMRHSGQIASVIGDRWPQ